MITKEEYEENGKLGEALGTDLRQLIGRLLFCERQRRGQQISTVSIQTGLTEQMIDAVELALGKAHWTAVAILLRYYKKQLSVRLTSVGVVKDGE